MSEEYEYRIFGKDKDDFQVFKIGKETTAIWYCGSAPDLEKAKLFIDGLVGNDDRVRKEAEEVEKRFEERRKAREAVFQSAHGYQRSSEKYKCECGKHVSDPIHFVSDMSHWYLPDVDITKLRSDNSIVLCKCGRTEAHPIHIEMTNA